VGAAERNDVRAGTRSEIDYRDAGAFCLLWYAARCTHVGDAARRYARVPAPVRDTIP
jgi:hypothetical protein